MVLLCLHLLLLYSQLVLQLGHPSFQLNNPPLGLNLTPEQSPVAFLHLSAKLILLVGNALHSRMSQPVLHYPHSQRPMKLRSVHIKCTLRHLLCRPFPVHGFGNYGGGWTIRAIHARIIIQGSSSLSNRDDLSA